jgi:hypothetical protein
MDADNDGVKDASETPLGGVNLRLVGTDIFGEPVDSETTTNALGDYQFVDLVPGSYEVVQTQPAFLTDGIDHAQGVFYAAGRDTLPIELGQDSDITNFDFGERGRAARHITLADFFASRSRQAVLVSASTNGRGQWYAINGSWPNAASVNVELKEDLVTAQIDITTTDAQQYSTTVNLGQRDQVQLVSGEGPSRLMRIVSQPQLLFPGFDCGCSDDGEGESSAAAVVGSSGAEGEAPGVVNPLLVDAQQLLAPTSYSIGTSSPTPSLLADAPDAEGEATDAAPAQPGNAPLAADLLLADPAMPVGHGAAATQLATSVGRSATGQPPPSWPRRWAARLRTLRRRSTA